MAWIRYRRCWNDDSGATSCCFRSNTNITISDQLYRESGAFSVCTLPSHAYALYKSNGWVYLSSTKMYGVEHCSKTKRNGEDEMKSLLKNRCIGQRGRPGGGRGQRRREPCLSKGIWASLVDYIVNTVSRYTTEAELNHTNVKKTKQEHHWQRSYFERPRKTQVTS